MGPMIGGTQPPVCDAVHISAQFFFGTLTTSLLKESCCLLQTEAMQQQDNSPLDGNEELQAREESDLDRIRLKENHNHVAIGKETYFLGATDTGTNLGAD